MKATRKPPKAISQRPISKTSKVKKARPTYAHTISPSRIFHENQKSKYLRDSNTKPPIINALLKNRYAFFQDPALKRNFTGLFFGDEILSVYNPERLIKPTSNVHVETGVVEQDALENTPSKLQMADKAGRDIEPATGDEGLDKDYVDARLEAVEARTNEKFIQLTSTLKEIASGQQRQAEALARVEAATTEARNEAISARNAASSTKWNIAVTGIAVAGVLLAAFGMWTQAVGMLLPNALQPPVIEVVVPQQQLAPQLPGSSSDALAGGDSSEAPVPVESETTDGAATND